MSKKCRNDPATLARNTGLQLAQTHPVLAPLAESARFVVDSDRHHVSNTGWFAVSPSGTIWLHAKRCADAEAWARIAGIALVCLGFGLVRRQEPYVLWEIASLLVADRFCDELKLIEMGVGTPPSIGLLHDAKLAGQSAEEIYDLLAADIRRARKLATLRGIGEQDLIGDDDGSVFTDAETYCRRALAQGFDRYVYNGCRGLIPAGLIEEIRSLSQPPIPWDVKLAQWFDERFPPPELRRSYARPSRRQASTPDIPRPSITKPTEEERRSRVFGVLLDTSGSMEPQLLGKALGAIASYALARDVIAVRLVCCDAQAYDSGWVEPERLLDRFSLRGRGGTVLQPGLDCFHDLARQGDFPRLGPLLVITDGYCEEHIQTAMDHAFLLPQGRRLPFRPRGDVFFVS